MSLYQEGTFKAVVKDYGYEEGREDQEPPVFILFDVAFPGGLQEMKFRSYMHTDAAREFTFKVLDVVGFRGNDPADIAKGFEGDAIPVGREVNVVIEKTEKDGKTYHNIKYVNSINGQGPGVKRISPAMAKKQLAGLKGAFAKYRALNPAPAVEKEPWE